MSVKIMGAVWEMDLPHNQMLTLLALADHADHDGNNAYPGVDRLAWKTGYSRRQVQRILTNLEEAGIIEAQGARKGGRGLATAYRINPSAGRQKEALETLRKGDILSDGKGDILSGAGEKGDISDIERVTSAAGKGDIAVSPQPSGNHQGEPSKQTTTPSRTPEHTNTHGDGGSSVERETPTDVQTDVTPPVEIDKAAIRGQMQELVDEFMGRVEDGREKKAVAATLRVIVSGSDMTSWRNGATGAQVPWQDRPDVLDVALAKYEAGERDTIRGAMILAVQQQKDPLPVRTSNAPPPGSEAAGVLARGRSSLDEDRPTSGGRTANIDAERLRKEAEELEAARRWLAEHPEEAQRIGVDVDEEIAKNEYMRMLGESYLSKHRDRELQRRALALMKQAAA